jgi:cell division protein FtsW
MKASYASPNGLSRILSRPLFRRAPEEGPIDPVLAAVVIALIGFGVVMVYSASAIEATLQMKDPQYYLKKEVFYAVVALGVLWLTSHIDYHRYRRATYPILLVVTALLVACVVGFGHMGGGARRWLALGPIHIQPAEMAKLGLVLWLSYSLSKKADKIRTLMIGFVPHLIMAGFLVFLCLKQPDFGSSVVLLFLTFTMMFVAGAKIIYLLGGTIAGGLMAAGLVYTRPYMWQRLMAFLDMAGHRQDAAYQPFQSVMSFGSGGLAGLGLGRGLQVLYLPEAHNDFIAAIVGEELGFIGVLGLCATYLLLVSRGVRVAFQAKDDYGSYIAFGISTLFGVQAMVNLAVAMAILPTKGLTLPFVSYGGSSLLVNAMAAGILLNVSRQRRDTPLPIVSEKVDAPEASAVVMTSAGEGTA